MKNSKITIVIAFFSVYVIWGSTYLLNKIVVSEIPPLSMTSIRCITAGVLIMMIAKLMNLSIKITKNQLINTTIVGFLFLVLGQGVIIGALKYVDSGFMALLASTQPLFVLLLMRLIDGKKMQRKSIIGVCLGIFGIYLLVSQKDIITSERNILAIFVILTCVLSWSYGSVFVSKVDLPNNFFVSTGYQMIIGGILLLFFSLLCKETWSSPMDWSFKAQVSMLLLIIFGSIVAFTAFNYLLKVVSPEKASTVSYVNPVIALFLGWYFLNEKLTIQSIVASAILLTGVYFITSRKRLS